MEKSILAFLCFYEFNWKPTKQTKHKDLANIA